MSQKRLKTLDEIKALDKSILLPADVCGYLKCDPYKINCQAQHNPAKLGFPVSVIGNRVKIPKAGFIAWAEGLDADNAG